MPSTHPILRSAASWDSVWITGYSSLIGLGKSVPTKRPLCETWARMSHPDPNGPPDRRPIKVGEVWENPVTGERLVILERPWDNPASRAKSGTWM